MEEIPDTTFLKLFFPWLPVHTGAWHGLLTTPCSHPGTVGNGLGCQESHSACTPQAPKDFYQAEVDRGNEQIADGRVSNTSQEDPPDSTPLTPDGSPTPLAQLHRESPAARRVNKNCCSLQGKEDKSRKDVGLVKPGTGTGLHLPRALDNWDGVLAALCVPWCSTGSLCPGVLQAAGPSLPTRCEHSWPRKHLPLPQQRCTAGETRLVLSLVPRLQTFPKSPRNKPRALFCSSEKQPPVGKGEPGAIRAASSGAKGGHTPRDSRCSQLVPSSSRSALLFHGNKSRGGAGIPGCFLQEGAWGAGTEMLPGCACSFPR